jgi:hypothetical protein
MKQAETRLNDFGVRSSRATWVEENFITDDTEVLAAEAQEQLIAVTTELVQQAKRFDGLDMPPELARKFKLLRLSLTLPAPSDPAERAELTRIATWLNASYGKGRYCPKQPIPGETEKCLDITAIERIMATNRDPKVLQDLWVGWRTISPPMRPKYTRFVELANKGAHELGFANMGAMWRSNCDMQPRDRDVVCHASAWDIDNEDDVRLKVCFQPLADDFITAHHELGHNFYQRAYKNQPPLFQNGANDGFHEAIGDTIALSITPEYLHEIGLLAQVPPATEQNDIAYLLRQALDKVAFLPFGLLIDEWRWKLFSGEITPADYNKSWWELRNKYQGVSAPASRSEADFDPGAKYHVDSNTPYVRYFLARILQFQFYRGICKTAGYTGPLHRCTFYNNKSAGERLNNMLAMGQSQPWPVALQALTGEKDIDAGALLEYFAPLQKWLEEQNKGHKTGW